MPNPARLANLVLTSAALSAGTWAQDVVTLNVDPDGSDYVSEVCLMPGGGLPARCDDPASTVGGEVEIELDSYANPAFITLHGYVFPVEDVLVYNFDWGPDFGSITITISNSSLRYGSLGVPTDPTTVGNNGFFQFPGEVDARLSGSGTYTGTGLFAGVNGSFELADLGEFPTEVFGFVQVAERQVTLDMDVGGRFDADLDGILVSVEADADARAIGEAPCRVDMNNDDMVDTRDFLDFLNLWSDGDLAADFTGDGVVNTQDVIRFLNDWTLGC